MALVKYGGGIVQMSGSIAGTTHARNRFGNYVRARTKPINPKSSRQVGIRVIMMFLAEQWRESPMTDLKRQAWATYADSVNWQNKLGEVVKLTGYQHFMRSNTSLLANGAAIVTDGPTDLGLPAGDPVFSITNIDQTTDRMIVTFDDTMDWCDEDGAFLTLSFGQPQNPTRNFFDGPWRFAVGVPGSSVAPPGSPIIDAQFSTWTPIAGQKIWIKASILRKDGRVSTKFQCDPTIVIAT